MEKIKCVIEQVKFRNPDNGYAVLQVDVDGSFGWQTITGVFPEVNIGISIVAEGEWTTNKYGRQFAVQSWVEELPASILGIEKYLSSGLIRGIGKKKARDIVKHFGERTMDILENDIDRLNKVPGIGGKCLKQIKESWAEHKALRNVMVFLQSYGVSTTYAVKIYKEYKNESIKKVKENPYCLADDIFGIGFKIADDIAFRLGYTHNDPRRLRSGIIYTLNQLANDGHCYSERKDLTKSASILLSANEQPINEVLKEMIADETLMLDGEAVFLPIYYCCEKGVANRLKKLLRTKDKSLSVDKIDIAKIEQESHITYDDVQIDAIKEAIRSKVMVLTGGPGTGKTTTILGIIAALESFGKDILCAAPTGRAAKRMSESTGRDACTIHRLLEYNPQDGFQKNDKNKLCGDVLIIDESSMIDIMLMNSLIKAVPKKMRLILVGDIDQLPSVGAGNVLRDIIDSGVVPVVRLTRIFRQALTSRIVTNAHKVNKGEYPDVSNERDSDFFLVSNDNPEQAAKEIVNLVNNRIPKAYNYSTNDIQVLAPMIKGAVGTQNLNIALQEAINPNGEYIACGAYKYRKGDRVMQIRNNYEKNVFNGDIGFISEVNTDERKLTVMFDKNEVEYESGNLTELTLAYACTIHKSQGSEYPVVVMPLMMSHYVMLQRNLVYTGITRAKKLCIIVGESKALHFAVKNFTVLKRNTMLKERLNDDTTEEDKEEDDGKENLSA